MARRTAFTLQRFINKFNERNANDYHDSDDMYLINSIGLNVLDRVLSINKTVTESHQITHQIDFIGTN